MNKYKMVLLLVLIASLFGCVETKRDVQEEANVKRCVDMGGLPIRSIWDGRLVDCKFKPKPPES